MHRRQFTTSEVTHRKGIPVTTPLITLIDIAPSLTDRQLRAAINEADKLNLIQAHRIPALVDAVRPRPGTGRLKEIAKQHKRTDSDLELALLDLIRAGGLPLPETQVILDGDRVDFYWPELELVVEADHSRYHRTPHQQAADRSRDHRHALAERTPLRFSEQHIDDAKTTTETLRAVIERLTAENAAKSGGKPAMSGNTLT